MAYTTGDVYDATKNVTNSPPERLGKMDPSTTDDKDTKHQKTKLVKRKNVEKLSEDKETGIIQVKLSEDKETGIIQVEERRKTDEGIALNKTPTAENNDSSVYVGQIQGNVTCRNIQV